LLQCKWLEDYGGEGLGSTIVYPKIMVNRVENPETGKWGSMVPSIVLEVVIASPQDAGRLARLHVQKQPNFTTIMYGSIISTPDNTKWKEQREHFVTGFLPKASLEKIFPVSLARARECELRMAELATTSANGGKPLVDMSEFFLHETKAQLQLALMGLPQDFVDKTNQPFRHAMMGKHDPQYPRKYLKSLVKEMEAGKDRFKAPNTDDVVCPMSGVTANSSQCPISGAAGTADECPKMSAAAAAGGCPMAGATASGSKCPVSGASGAGCPRTAAAAGGCPMAASVVGPLSERMNSADLSSQDTFGNAFIFAFAGHDTTGHTLTFMAYELARQPLLQERLRREVHSWFQSIESQKREVTYTDLAHLPFLTRCWTETLRLWPAVTNGTYRQLQVNDYVHAKFKNGSGDGEVMVPKGTLVNIPNWPRHRNVDLWGPDANEFNPDREFKTDEIWNGDVFRAYNPSTERFSPFTFAPRDCIGKNFAHMEARLIMAHMLRRFRLELSEQYVNMDRSKFLGVNYGTMGPQDMTLDDMVKAYPGWGPPMRRPTGLPIHVLPLEQ
jgi:hypothetical protein